VDPILAFPCKGLVHDSFRLGGHLD
jgi:hypothetical protein